STAFVRLDSHLSQVRASLIQLGVASAGIGLAAKEAISFESAMSDVRKVVDFPTPKAFDALTADIKAMSREIPVALVELAKIAEAGGQMGIAANDIREFTDVVAKMATTFKIPAQEAGVAIGRLINVFALTIPETRLLSDAINHLGNNTNAVEKDIVEVMNRVGGMSRVFGLANTETAALATTFLSMGLGPERSATAINALMRELQNAPIQTKRFQTALNGIGMTGNQVAAMIKAGPQQALLVLLDTIAKLDKQSQMETLTGLFGDMYSDEIVQVVNNLNKYRSILDLVADRTHYAGSMQREFEERLKTTKTHLDFASNAFSEAGVNIGYAFLPAIRMAADGVSWLGRGIADVADRFPNLTAGALTAVTALVGFGALRLVWTVVGSGVTGLIAPIGLLASGARNAATQFGVWGLAQMAVARPLMAMGAGLVTLGGHMTGLARLIMGPLATALRFLVFSPVGGALTLIAMAFYAVSKATEEVVPDTDAAAQALDKTKSAAEGAAPAANTAAQALDKTKSAAAGMAPATDQATIALDKARTAAAGVAPATGQAATALDKARTAAAGVTTSTDQATTALQNLSNVMPDITAKSHALQSDLTKLNGALEGLEKERVDAVKQANIEIVQDQKKAAEERVRATESAIQESIRKEESLVERMRSLSKELVDMSQSSADRRREMARKGMNDEAAEADRVREAFEKIAKAKELVAKTRIARDSGDLKAAQEYAEAAKKNAEQAQRMAGSFQNVNTALRAFDAAEDVAKTAQEALIKMSGTQLTQQERVTKSLQKELEKQKRDVQAFAEELDALNNKRTLVRIDAEIQEAKARIRQIKEEIDALPTSKTVTITTRNVKEYGGGGLVTALAMARGGSVPGVGDKDTVPIMAMPGEFMINKQSVRKFPGLAEAFNAGNVVQMREILGRLPRFARGGPIGFPVPRLPEIPRFASGGMVQAAPVSRDTVNITLTIGDRKIEGLTGDRQLARRIDEAMREMSRGRVDRFRFA
ncbi:MAG: phage tail tape measure protein, partial [Magnetococcales bacterium]|nr:phage tail tape measure protein [Magnetococcales bacterium]